MNPADYPNPADAYSRSAFAFARAHCRPLCLETFSPAYVPAAPPQPQWHAPIWQTCGTVADLSAVRPYVRQFADAAAVIRPFRLLLFPMPAGAEGPPAVLGSFTAPEPERTLAALSAKHRAAGDVPEP